MALSQVFKRNPTPEQRLELGQELVAALSNRNGIPDFIKAMKLIKHGADPAAEDSWKRTPLMLAASLGHRECVSALIANGADLETKDNSGETAIMHAVRHRQMECFDILKGAGARLDQKDGHGKSILQLAVEERNEKVVEFLLRSGFDPDVVDNNGFTPAIAAACEGSLHLINILVNAGVDFNKNIKRAKKLQQPENVILILSGAKKAQEQRLNKASDCGRGLAENLRAPLPLRLKRPIPGMDGNVRS